MSWSAAKIRKLRLCLGWSRNDLARRMNCEVNEIESWETEVDFPSFEQSRHLDLIERHRDLAQKTVAEDPKVESFLEETQHEQVEYDEVEH